VIALKFQTEEIVMTIISRDGSVDSSLPYTICWHYVAKYAFGNTLVEKYELWAK
jgi:hypothetical protein